MKSSVIRQVVILGAIAIVSIIAIQSYWVLNTWDLKEQEFHRSVNIALRKVAENLSKLHSSVLPNKNLVTRLSSNYYVVNMEDVIDAGQLEFYLQKEFEVLSMNIDFEYAIFDCSSDEMVYGNYYTYSVEPKDNIELGKLPKYDQFTYYFGVKFPTRSGYLIGKMKLSIVFTVILFITVLFFAYAMFVILRQRRLSQMQKDFINNMTHEFKTPISTIKISADVFLNNEEIQKDDRLMQYAGIIKEQNQRLNDQVEKVLQLAKIERDSFKLHFEQVDLHELLIATLQSVELKVVEAGGVLKNNLKAKKPIIKADKLHLSNIVYNLLDNAVKYCKENPEITVETRNVGDKILLKIKDKGIGIAKENQSKVFDKFYRIPTGNVHNVKGFGLGLFYLKKICDAHGWKITLKSELNNGTSISILMKK
jgi:two-component system, OmpR family, phosphate regulon sensor histidine kinase PhoR